MSANSFSRRSALSSAGLAVAAPAAATAGPAGPMLARVIGTLTPGGRRALPFEGRLSMVSVTGHAMPAFGFRGVVETQFTGEGDKMLCHRRWSGTLTDLSGAPLPGPVANPVTGQRLTVPAIDVETSFDMTGEGLALRVRDAGAFVVFDFTEPGPSMLTASLRQSYTALRAHIDDPSRDAVTAHGAWRTTGPWPQWLAMGAAPGRVEIEGRIGTTEELLQV